MDGLHISRLSHSLLGLPVLESGLTCLTRRQLCQLLHTCRLVETAPSYAAPQVCSFEVCTHVVSSIMHATFHGSARDIEFILFGAVRALSFLGGEPRAAKKLVDFVGGKMLARALILAIQTLSSWIEGCPLWTECISSLTKVLSNCFMVFEDSDAGVLLESLCRTNILNLLFACCFGVEQVSKENKLNVVLDIFVCHIASLMVQVAHWTCVLGEASLVESALCVLFEMHFFDAICSYFASYCLRTRHDMDSNILLALFCSLLVVSAAKSDAFFHEEKSHYLRVLIKTSSSHLNEPVMLSLLQESLEQGCPGDIFQVSSPRDFCVKFLKLDVSAVPSCCWCGKVEVSLPFACSICCDARFCGKQCRDNHWNLT